MSSCDDSVGSIALSWSFRGLGERDRWRGDQGGDKGEGLSGGRGKTRGLFWRKPGNVNLEVTGGWGGMVRVLFLMCDMYAPVVKMYKQQTNKGCQKKQSTKQ